MRESIKNCQHTISMWKAMFSLPTGVSLVAISLDSRNYEGKEAQSGKGLG